MSDEKFKGFSTASGIGDLTSIMHNQGVSDLSWLSVDEAEYRKFEALPKQNFDIIPELQDALTMKDGDDVPHVIPMKPHTIVNQNPTVNYGSKPDLTVPIRNRVARLVMAGLAPAEIQNLVSQEFAKEDILASASEIREVMSESGLLGNVYIDSKHFPKCHQNTASDKKLLASNKKSLYVLGKPECTDCVHNRNGNCASFQKTLVNEVPYGSKLASSYVPYFLAEKKDFIVPESGSPNAWKESIRTAFQSAPNVKSSDSNFTLRTQKAISPVKVSSEDIQDFLERKSQEKKTTVLSSDYIKFARRMMAGHDDREILIGSGNPELVKLAHEFGLLGHTWLDMDAAGSCRQILAYLKSIESKVDSEQNNGFGGTPDFILRRSASCPNCACQDGGPCSLISKKSTIVDSIPPYDKRIYAKALIRAVGRGAITQSDAKKTITLAGSSSDWKKLTAEANQFKFEKPTSQNYSGPKFVSHTSTSTVEVTNVIDENSVRMNISKLMNLGYSGKALQAKVLEIYASRDLAPFAELGKRLASEDGIQGAYYVDPTAYSDYGAGCQEGSSKLKRSTASHVMAHDKCTGCVYQSCPGWCSRYAKELIRSVPEDVRIAAKRLPVIQNLPVKDPTIEFGIKSPTMDFEISNRSASLDIAIRPKSIEK